MKVKLFVFSDVHGHYEALRVALREAGYNKSDPTHRLLSIGDNFDRGVQSAHVYQYLKDNKAICVKGNHETFLEEALEKGMDGEYVLFNFLRNGLDQTIQSLSGFKFGVYEDTNRIGAAIAQINCLRPELKEWLANMPLVYQTKNYIFAHAGIHPYSRLDHSLQDKDFILWDIEYSHCPVDSTHKTVVIGHHHAFRVRQRAEENGYCEDILHLPYYGNQDEHRPVRIGNKIAIDPCSNYTNKVNVIVIEDELLEEEVKVEEQSEPIFNENVFSIGIDPTATWATYYNDPTTTIRFR